MANRQTYTERINALAGAVFPGQLGITEANALEIVTDAEAEIARLRVVVRGLSEEVSRLRSLVEEAIDTLEDWTHSVKRDVDGTRPLQEAADDLRGALQDLDKTNG